MPRENFKVNINVNIDMDLKDVSLATANEKKEKLARILSNCISERSEFDLAKKRINVSMKTESE